MNRRALIAAVLTTFTLVAAATACGGREAAGTPTPSAVADANTPAPTRTPTPPPWAVHPELGLFLADADGGNIRRIWDGDASFPQWSPDGRRIAIFGEKEGKAGVYVIDPDTGAATYAGSSSNVQIRWSPDGRNLLLRPLNGSSQTPGAGHLAIVDASTGEEHPLDADGIYGEWSPDGLRIAFSGPECADGERRRAYDLRSGTIADLAPQYADASAYLSPNWSHVAYFRGRIFYTDAPPDPTLYVADPDGSHERALFTGPQGTYPSRPAWSPDGAWIVYNTRLNGGLYLLRADGTGGPITLAAPGQDSYAADWTADSTRLVVYNGDQTFIYNVRDSTETSVTVGSLARWSPDGSRLISGGGTTSPLAIYDIITGTTSPVRTDPSVIPFDPRWSPDGHTIAFIGASGPRDYGICI